MSQQDSAQATGTVTSVTTTVTATSGIFTAAMVGNGITDGTTYRYITAFTSSTVVTVDSAPSWTAATIYVGGALASPGKACGLAASGNIIYVKSGTYLVTTASTNVAAGCCVLQSSTGNNIAAIIGYQTTRGDRGAQPLLQASSSISTFVLVQAAGGNRVENISVDGNSYTSSRGIYAASGNSHVVTCKAVNCTNGGIRIEGNAMGEFCEASGCSTTAAIQADNIAFSIAHDNTFTGFANINTRSATVACISYNNSGASSDGFSCTAGSAIYDACVAYNNGRNGYNLTSSSSPALFTNCVATSNTSNGFTTASSTTAMRLYNCAGYNNGTNVNANVLSSTGFVTLTADPFTSASGGDFSTNSTAGGGAALRGAALPQSFPGALTSSRRDIGAAQHADSGLKVVGFAVGGFTG